MVSSSNCFRLDSTRLDSPRRSWTRLEEHSRECLFLDAASSLLRSFLFALAATRQLEGGLPTDRGGTEQNRRRAAVRWLCGEIASRRSTPPTVPDWDRTQTGAQYLGHTVVIVIRRIIAMIPATRLPPPPPPPRKSSSTFQPGARISEPFSEKVSPKIISHRILLYVLASSCNILCMLIYHVVVRGSRKRVFAASCWRSTSSFFLVFFFGSTATECAATTKAMHGQA